MWVTKHQWLINIVAVLTAILSLYVLFGPDLFTYVVSARPNVPNVLDGKRVLVTSAVIVNSSTHHRVRSDNTAGADTL